MNTENLYRLYKECGSISTDSRKLSPGSIFFALRGENFDGNRFAFESLDKNCRYAVVDDPALPPHDRLIHVKDVLTSLQDLARYHRSLLSIPVIGITGSNGKTTTKELLMAVLGRKYKVCATIGNLNNHIGVPLTLLTIQKDQDIAIIEMGANHTGEIAALCRIADPNYGIITNIGKAHLGGFGSPEGVIKAKSELYDHLAARKGKVFVDAGNKLLKQLSDERNTDSVFYGNSPFSVCSGKITDNSKFLKARIRIHGISRELEISTSLVGDYNLDNILAAACIGNFFGVRSNDITAAISEYTPSNSRSQLLITSRNKIVLDAYNANPTSMEGALKNFLSMKEDMSKLIILGDMLELGSYSRSEHQAIIDLVIKNNFTNLVLVGPEFCSLPVPPPVICFGNVEAAIEHFLVNPVKEHSILLKGSRGIKLEKLIEVL